MADEHELQLAETFAELARTLLAEHGLQATLVKICSTVVDTVDGCESAGISLIEKRKISTVGSSSEVPERVDAIQYETDEGPCLDAIREREVFRAGDLRSDNRWPAFASRAAEETGVRSMLCFRLFVEEDTMGALNLCSRVADAFDHDAEIIGGVFAAHAAVAMSNAREVEGLKVAIESRGVIERAKGIIMASTGCSDDEAFELLKQQSQMLNEKLRDVAAGIAERTTRPN